MVYDLALINGTIINAAGEIFSGNIGIVNNTVVYIGHEKITGKKTINCKGKYISPTFVNGHSHVAMSLLKGVAEDVSIESWFNDYVWPIEQHLTKDDVYHGALIGFKEMIENGISVVADHYMFANEIIAAAKISGIHLDMAPTVFSINDIEEGINDTIALSEKYRNDELIKISFGPHSAYTVNPSDLEKIAAAAKKHALKIHIHVSENDLQVQQHLEKYHMTPLETLKKTGVLDNECILAHALSTNQNDVKLMEQAVIVNSPKTYLRLSMPYEKMFQENKNFIFGSDGAVSSATLNILEQSALFSMLAKAKFNNPQKYPVKEIWKILMKAHDVFNFNTGDIKEGKKADLIIWNFNDAACMASFNILATIIYCADKTNIEKVICNGKVISGQKIDASLRYVKKRKKVLQKLKLSKSALVF